MSCGIGPRYGLNPTLLWLWCRLAVVAPIWPLAQEPPYAVSVAIKSKKKKTNKQKNFCSDENILYLDWGDDYLRYMFVITPLNSNLIWVPLLFANYTSFPASSSFWSCTLHVPWLTASSSTFKVSSQCFAPVLHCLLSQISLYLPLIKVFVMAFWVHSDNTE